MSPTWDTVVTVAVFVLLLVPLFFVIASAPLHFMQTDGVGERSSPVVVYLAIAMVVIPPLLAAGVYAAGVVMALLADGPTWYYPLIAGAAGGALWFGALSAGAAAVQWLYRREKP